MEKINSFAPLIDEQARILILGSVPSVESLRRSQYYGNPRNHFWPILYRVFDLDYRRDESYGEKTAMLRERGIALWDVIRDCRRTGSLDASITEEEANDFPWLFGNYPRIRCVLFNGGKAYETYGRKVGLNTFPDLTCKKLPSTSPANTMPLAEKLQAWQIIRELTGNDEKSY